MSKEIRVTFQKNVLIFTPVINMTKTHTTFSDWVQKSGVTEFKFRPADKDDLPLIKRRVNKLKKMGFKCSDNDDVHHFMTAKKAS